MPDNHAGGPYPAHDGFLQKNLGLVFCIFPGKGRYDKDVHAEGLDGLNLFIDCKNELGFDPFDYRSRMGVEGIDNRCPSHA
jgi:hypothetical protein